MIVLSDRFKHSFKVALAMTLTYGIALSMNWEKPFWAALAVAFCSLATAGESINRGLQRILGTLVAGIATVALVATFPQERWLFLISMSAFLALCTYKVSGGSRYLQIWFNAGFNIPILAMLGQGIALNSFEFIVLRAQETALGAIVYSLVAILLWPRRAGQDFENATRQVCHAEHQLFRRYVRSLMGVPDDGAAERLRNQLPGQLARLGELLDGAVYDSDEIQEVSHAWRRCNRDLSALSQALERWRVGVEEQKELDLQRLIPAIAAFAAELDTRFAAIEAMLEGQAPPQQPRSVALSQNPEAIGALSHFQRAAALQCRDRLTDIDRLTLALFETVSEIRGYGKSTVPIPEVAMKSSPAAIIDPDRLAATIRQSAALWIALLMVIYVPAFPNPVGVVALVNAFAMVLSIAPHIPATVLLLPTVIGSIFAGILYIFVMPHLSGFEEMGVMIFFSTFIIVYAFYQPKYAMAKTMGLCMFVIMIGVENQQTYNFAYFSAWFLCGIIFVSILIAAWRFPISFQPEHRFLELLARFYRSAEFLLSTSGRNAGRKKTWLFRLRRAFYLQEMMVLPQRLRAWGAALSPVGLGNTGADQLQNLLMSIEVLSERVRNVRDAQSGVRSEMLTRELLMSIQAWRVGVLETLERLAADPGMLDHMALCARLEETLTRLKRDVEKALDRADGESLSTGESENVYRFLGACRGLSDAVLNLARHVPPIDWARLREARF